MDEQDYDVRRLVVLLRRRLPFPARAGAPLFAGRHPLPALPRGSRNCMVTQVYDAGDRLGLMCQIEFAGEMRASPVFVASIMQLSFDRTHFCSRAIGAYRKGRRERAGASDTHAEEGDGSKQKQINAAEAAPTRMARSSPAPRIAQRRVGQ